MLSSTHADSKFMPVPKEYAQTFSFVGNNKLLFFRSVLRLSSKRQKVLRIILIDTDGNVLLYSAEGDAKRKIFPRDINAVYADTQQVTLIHSTEHDLAIDFHGGRSNLPDATPKRFLQVLAGFLSKGPWPVKIVKVPDALEKIESLDPSKAVGIKKAAQESREANQKAATPAEEDGGMNTQTQEQRAQTPQGQPRRLLRRGSLVQADKPGAGGSRDPFDLSFNSGGGGGGCAPGGDPWTSVMSKSVAGGFATMDPLEATPTFARHGSIMGTGGLSRKGSLASMTAGGGGGGGGLDRKASMTSMGYPSMAGGGDLGPPAADNRRTSMLIPGHPGGGDLAPHATEREGMNNNKLRAMSTHTAASAYTIELTGESFAIPPSDGVDGAGSSGPNKGSIQSNDKRASMSTTLYGGGSTTSDPNFGSPPTKSNPQQQQYSAGFQNLKNRSFGSNPYAGGDTSSRAAPGGYKFPCESPPPGPTNGGGGQQQQPHQQQQQHAAVEDSTSPRGRLNTSGGGTFSMTKLNGMLNQKFCTPSNQHQMQQLDEDDATKLRRLEVETENLRLESRHEELGAILSGRATVLGSLAHEADRAQQRQHAEIHLASLIALVCRNSRLSLEAAALQQQRSASSIVSSGAGPFGIQAGPCLNSRFKSTRASTPATTNTSVGGGTNSAPTTPMGSLGHPHISEGVQKTLSKRYDPHVLDML